MEIVIKKFNELALEELYEILKIRAEIFVVEQECPYNDVDGKDIKSTHIMIKNNGKIEWKNRRVFKSTTSWNFF
ncbi:MAG: hypothetical protein MJH09_09830 [Cetobacterium sp.]|nr:hypothetical protein [Cetobacterium sp.]